MLEKLESSRNQCHGDDASKTQRETQLEDFRRDSEAWPRELLVAAHGEFYTYWHQIRVNLNLNVVLLVREKRGI